MVFSDDEVRGLVAKIEEGRLKAGMETNKRHVDFFRKIKDFSNFLSI